MNYGVPVAGVDAVMFAGRVVTTDVARNVDENPACNQPTSFFDSAAVTTSRRTSSVLRKITLRFG